MVFVHKLCFDLNWLTILAMMKATRMKMSPRRQKFQNWKQNTKRLVFHLLKSKWIQLKWKYHQLNDPSHFLVTAKNKSFKWESVWLKCLNHFMVVGSAQIQLDITKGSWKWANCNSRQIESVTYINPILILPRDQVRFYKIVEQCEHLFGGPWPRNDRWMATSQWL